MQPGDEPGPAHLEIDSSASGTATPDAVRALDGAATNYTPGVLDPGGTQYQGAVPADPGGTQYAPKPAADLEGTNYKHVPADPYATNYASDGKERPGHRRRFGNYELLEKIAQGGMGVVWKARLVGADRIVALKMILHGDFAAPDAVERFRTEARAAAALDHPGIVPIYDIGEAEGRPYFTMPLVNGGSLQQLLADGPLPPKVAARLVQQVAEAVHYAHDRGLIHRDIKPHNILLQHEGSTPGDARVADGRRRARERGHNVTPSLTDVGLTTGFELVDEPGPIRACVVTAGQVRRGRAGGSPWHQARGVVGKAWGLYALLATEA